MDYIQNVQPNIHVAGTSGWCLQYVDDGVNAPDSHRQGSAQASWEYAVSIGKAHAGQEPPQKVWVPIYYTIDNGRFAGLGHVAWYYNDGKNTVIYDSEYASGKRSTPYGSGSELIRYMGWQMRYLGWSEHLDGLDIVKPKQAPKPTPEQAKKQKGLVKLFITDPKGTYGKKEKGAQYMISSTGVYHISPKESEVLTKKIGAPLVIGKDINEAEVDIIKATLIYGKK